MATISSEEALNLLSKKDKAYVKKKGGELIQAYRVLADIPQDFFNPPCKLTSKS